MHIAHAAGLVVLQGCEIACMIHNKVCTWVQCMRNQGLVRLSEFENLKLEHASVAPVRSELEF